MPNPDDIPDADPVPEALPQRVSLNRPAPIVLPADPAASAAVVLRYVQTGSAAFDRASALEAMNLRLAKLASADTDTALSELSAHVLVLDALVHRWTVAAVQATKPEAIAVFAKLALSSQAAHVRTMIAIEGLKAQRLGSRRLIAVEHDADA